MRDLRHMLGGLGAKARSGGLQLHRLPLIAEVEAMHDTRGGAWSSAYDDAVDRASLAYFGVTPAETNPAEPHPDQIEDREGRATWFSNEALGRYDAVLTVWHNWQATMRGMESDVDRAGPEAFWNKLGVDVTNGRGQVLRCLPRFERQLYAAVKGLLPGAKLTPQGGGRRAAQSVDDWAAALARDAARFRASR